MLNDDDERQDNKRKRLSDEEKETETPGASTSTVQGSAGAAMDGPDASKLVEEMGLELSCGCCTEMCYNPIIVLPCQHYYCGRCVKIATLAILTIDNLP
jgi:E3 ubiquitin-protein ligase CHFR